MNNDNIFIKYILNIIDDECLSHYYIFHYLSVKALQAHKKATVF